MKCIVGLGNPGKKYERTRHNIGFTVLDKLADHLKFPLNQRKFSASYGIDYIEGTKVCLMKPLTYMNLSGEAVGSFANYFDVSAEDILVIYDDLDLPVGKIRLRQKGGTGGHNGMKSMIAHLGRKDFKRIRVGIGRPAPGETVIDYVLQRFHPDERMKMSDAASRSVEACEAWLTNPFPEVMNRYNADE
jgi:PTH1 family peptidyl-tRNA hydrolase